MKQTIELKIFKGKEIDYDASGKPKNKQQKLTLTYGDLQFPKHLANIKNLGVCKVDVVAMYDEKGAAIELKQEVIDEVMKLIYNEPVKELTADQKRIADLEARLDAVTNPVPEVKAEPSEELKAARAEYEKAAGKKGSPNWTLEQVLAKTAEIKKQTK